jgi:hypothetical protein
MPVACAAEADGLQTIIAQVGPSFVTCGDVRQVRSVTMFHPTYVPHGEGMDSRFMKRAHRYCTAKYASARG